MLLTIIIDVLLNEILIVAQTPYYMKKKTPNIEPSVLIEFLDQQLNELPDKRTGKNIKYHIAEAVMAAFSVFFTQLPSFLEHQRFMKQQKGKDNASSLFGLEEIPCDNQIRALLDPVPAKIIFFHI